MKNHFIPTLSTVVLVMALHLGASRADESSVQNGTKPIRIATYNASLFGKLTGQVAERLSSGDNRQAQSIAAIIQTIRPDILLVNEIDHEFDVKTAKQLRDLYFLKGYGDRQPIDYPFVYSAPSNTGIASGLDLNGDGTVDGPDDAWGYGIYPGQYSFAIFSRFPIDIYSIRTFQKFNWSKLPGAIRPIDPESSKSFHSDEIWNALRLSSKNHVDVPIMIGERQIHVLASHPTPPVFDGPEDRNGCRNHDEIAFWSKYIEGDSAIIDDFGVSGGLAANSSFVIMGDLNSDPIDGDSRQDAIRALLSHPQITDPKPRRVSSTMATPDAEANDTADFGRVGEMRADYVLPSRDIKTTESQVFWPSQGEPGSDWIHASDHRMVWIDVILPVVKSVP